MSEEEEFDFEEDFEEGDFYEFSDGDCSDSFDFGECDPVLLSVPPRFLVRRHSQWVERVSLCHRCSHSLLNAHLKCFIAGMVSPQLATLDSPRPPPILAPPMCCSLSLTSAVESDVSLNESNELPLADAPVELKGKAFILDARARLVAKKVLHWSETA